MKYKITCEVTFPVYEVVFDVNIPINKSIYYVCSMLDKLIIEEIDPNYKEKDNSILINKKTGEVFDKNVLVKYSKMENGSKLTYF